MSCETSPCATCAFTDPRAYVDDHNLASKLIVCLVEHRPFSCHHRTADGTLPPCRGFQGFARALQGATRTQIRDVVHKLEMGMIERFLRSDDPLAIQVRAFNQPSFTPEELRLGIRVCQLADLTEGEDEEEQDGGGGRLPDRM